MSRSVPAAPWAGKSHPVARDRFGLRLDRWAASDENGTGNSVPRSSAHLSHRTFLILGATPPPAGAGPILQADAVDDEAEQPRQTGERGPVVVPPGEAARVRAHPSIHLEGPIKR
jgi:hypothetical protein